MNVPRELAVEPWFKELVHWFNEGPVTMNDSMTGRRYQLDWAINLEWVRSRLLYTAPESTRRKWNANFVLDCVADQARRLRGEP